MKKMDELLVENDRLRILARHDSLTGLFNRGAMEEEIGALLRNKKGGVFLMLDVDHFKDINDVYGHLTGDLVLQELSRIMGYLFFKKDIIGRMGGDEFAIFIPGGYRNELVDSKVERLHSRAAQAGKDMGIGNSLKLTVGADLARKNDTFHTLYRRADLALRFGKQRRKKSLYLYESSMEDCRPDSAARNGMPAAEGTGFCPGSRQSGLSDLSVHLPLFGKEPGQDWSECPDHTYIRNGPVWFICCIGGT